MERKGRHDDIVGTVGSTIYLGMYPNRSSGGALERSTRIRSVLVTTLIAVAAAACGNPRGGGYGQSISIDHEVIFPEIHGG
jgi:hypothetical protein